MMKKLFIAGLALFAAASLHAQPQSAPSGTLQECTMDEMIEHCAQFVDEVNKNMPKPMTKEEYKQMMRGFFPMLKRWRK